jgi:two-component system, NtrC family, sensor kinase
MQRRGESEQPVKGRRHRANRPKVPKAPIDRSPEEFHRLKRERDETLEQQAATIEVLRAISSSAGKLEPIFDTMLRNALRLCGAQSGHMLLFDGESFTIAAIKDTPAGFAKHLLAEPKLRAYPGSYLAQLVETKKTINVPDLRADKPYLERLPRAVAAVDQGGLRSQLMVPMIKEDKLIGSVNIYRQEVRPFTERQIALVENFATQAVIAIENTRLLNELRQRTDDLTESLEQQTATSEVLSVISSSAGELQPVFRTMLANATRLCEATFGSMLLTENDTFRRVAIHNAPPMFAEFHRKTQVIHPQRIPDLKLLIETKRPVHIADAAAMDTESAIVKFAGARTVLAVPMLKDGELVGGIAIYRQQVRPFTEKQIELVTNFAAQAVIAIENTRLLNELRESLQQQTATADVLKVISRSTFDLKTVLTTLVETAVRVCEADIGNIARPVDNHEYKIEASYGQSTALYEELARQTLRVGKGSVIGRTALNRAPVHILDAQTDPDYELRGALKIGDYHTMLGVPLVREGNIIGVFGLARKTVRPFTEKQIELVTTFADQAVIAIENIRLFDEVQGRTRELAASLDDLRTTQDRLVQTQKLALLGQLTAGIAHEIKNPLNFVNNFSGISAELINELQETLKGIPLDDKARTEINELTDTLKSNFDKVVHHGRRADAIVKNMLQHSREGSGEHRVIDINALIEESLNLAWHGARAEMQGFEIKLKQSFDPSAGGADVFPQDIRRAFLNMISNGFYAAIKRAVEINGADYEPTLTASTKNLGDRVEIRIRDNGTGMTADVKEKMFNPFFTTKPTGEGTGLGLSISYDIIVKQHGGSIEVDTQPGEFTEIKVILPRVAVFV